MSLIIHFLEIPELPKLAWLASIDKTTMELKIYHGSSVECGEKWMVEGVWDGEFNEGNFHKSENFFGSGVRIENDSVYFVSSTALDDRLLYCFYKGRVLVSNSLVLLLGWTGARLDPYHHYNESWSIESGIFQYERKFHILHPEIECFFQVYHANLVYEGGDIRTEIRSSLHEIASFEDYYSMLRSILNRIGENIRSSSRNILLKSFTTLSSGYDSTAVASLVKDIGVSTCFTSKYSSSNIPKWISKTAAIDAGNRIAEKLNLHTIYLEPKSKISEDELYFLAPAWAQFGTIFHSMASYIEKHYDAAVLFFGHHGDVLWDVNVNHSLINDSIMPLDLGGNNFSEIRLKSGIIQISVPYIMARNIDAIHKISQSDEMAPWRLNNAYDRPIPRRIAEEAGIPREYFGQRNKAVAEYYNMPQNKKLRREFFQYTVELRGRTRCFIYLYVFCNWIYYLVSRLIQYFRYFRNEDAMKSGMRSAVADIKLNLFWEEINLHRDMFIWAANTLSDRLRTILRGNIK